MFRKELKGFIFMNNCGFVDFNNLTCIILKISRKAAKSQRINKLTMIIRNIEFVIS